MKREGFQPKNSSVVYSVHFKADDFEIGNRSWNNRVHTYLKKHAVPSVFGEHSQPEAPQPPEKKRHVLQIVNPLLNVRPKIIISYSCS